jgi:hypothetical protein
MVVSRWIDGTMKTGLAYMGHHNPRHIAEDLSEIAALGCADVLVALQENDFVYMKGKVEFLPALAKERGIRPIAIFWGALNLFGGGRSSQFLLEHPECHQVTRDGGWHPEGCYNNPESVARIRQMIDRAGETGWEGYFIDEPTILDCFCDSCRSLYSDWYDGDLVTAADTGAFRTRSAVHYIETVTEYVKKNHPQMETSCCVMPVDRSAWKPASKVAGLDGLGTDIYWVNEDRDVAGMRPLIDDMEALCRATGKTHHEWLQCWNVRAGREHRILEQAKILLEYPLDALYLWAYEAQVGTNETCDDPEKAWEYGMRVLKMAST